MGTDLIIQIGELKLTSPLIVSSGCCEINSETMELIDLNQFGAYVTKTITFNERKGNPMPRTVEVTAGLLNSIGLQNDGLYGFLNKLLKLRQEVAIPIIASIAGFSIEEFAKLASHLAREKFIRALELNISCPNLEKGRDVEIMFAQDEHLSYGVVKAVRETTNLTLIVKLSPLVTNITSIAQAVWDAGADAITVANTYPAMAIDIKTRKPKLGAVTGGLSGPAIKPLTLRAVWDVYQVVKIPIIASGGIMNWEDAIEYIIAGATALAVGTALFINPKVGGEIIEGITKYLQEMGIGYHELIGSLQLD